MIPADPWAGLGPATIIQGDARNLPLPDNSVDLCITSPPYFALRSYQDGGEHYEGQIGSEPTPDEFVTSLLDATREMIRVTKPTGSIWVNLGDSYAGKAPGPQGTTGQRADRRSANEPSKARGRGRRPAEQMTRTDAAWLAGVIDSDGSVSIHINKQPEGRAPSFVPWVRIGQMRPEVVQHAAEITGIGQVMKDTRGVWSWSASAQQARWVLERIYPWLLIKARQAAAAVELARHVAARNGRGSYRPLTQEDITYRYALRTAVLAWNKGQDDPLEPPRPPHVTLPNYPRATPEKSLRGLPWRYALRCVDELGLILRANVCWSKPNGLPESVQDRVRRSHEDWFHFTLQPRYFSAVDEIREPHAPASMTRYGNGFGQTKWSAETGKSYVNETVTPNPLGKLPGSVWEIPTEPLNVPAHLGVDHFAAFPSEWPRRIIAGWSPTGVCTACGEGRRPVAVVERTPTRRDPRGMRERVAIAGGERMWEDSRRAITGYACACPDTSAPTTPATILDPFGGTGTVAMVARALGRHGISVDLSHDYCRLARWRVAESGGEYKVRGVDKPKVIDQAQASIFDALDGAAS